MNPFVTCKEERPASSVIRLWDVHWPAEREIPTEIRTGGRLRTSIHNIEILVGNQASVSPAVPGQAAARTVGPGLKTDAHLRTLRKALGGVVVRGQHAHVAGCSRGDWLHGGGDRQVADFQVSRGARGAGHRLRRQPRG